MRHNPDTSIGIDSKSEGFHRIVDILKVGNIGIPISIDPCIGHENTKARREPLDQLPNPRSIRPIGAEGIVSMEIYESRSRRQVRYDEGVGIAFPR